MIAKLFGLYRASPFWLRNMMARATWPVRLAMLPFGTIRVGGYRMVLDFMDNASFKYYTDRERYELAETTAFLSSILHNPGAYVIDVGANYGAFTLAAAQLGPFRVFQRILAIEPDRRACAALRKSIRKNHFHEFVDLHQVIAGDRDGRETLFVNARSSADNRTHKVTSSPIRVRAKYEVDCTTIDSLLAESSIPLDSRFIVKMDIQGNEAVAFRGMQTALRRAKGFLVFFEHCPYLIESAGINIAEYCEFLESLQADAIFEIGTDDVVRLDGFRGLLDSFRALESTPETRMEGTGSNYVLCRGMNLGGLESAAGSAAAAKPIEALGGEPAWSRRRSA